jgi:hypothetical protein
MIEDKIDKAMKPIPMPYEEFESFPKHVDEFGRAGTSQYGRDPRR